MLKILRSNPKVASRAFAKSERTAALWKLPWQSGSDTLKRRWPSSMRNFSWSAWPDVSNTIYRWASGCCNRKSSLRRRSHAATIAASKTRQSLVLALASP